MTLLADVLERGFDLSVRVRRDYMGRFSRAVRVRCSQCEAAVINGMATHETGCPNGRTYECRECGGTYRTREDAAACCA